MARILIVDDEAAIRDMLKTVLESSGHEVVAARDGTDALHALRKGDFNLVLSDIKMAAMSGIEFLRRVRVEFPQLPVIMLTGFASLNTASEALALGVFDYLSKPINLDDLRDVVGHALAASAAEVVVDEAFIAGYEKHYRLGGVVAASPAMRRVCDQVEQYGPSGANILISGEKGAGRRTIAGAIRIAAGRKDKPVVVINCAEQPESVINAMLLGKRDGARARSGGPGISAFEAADGGTLLLQGVDSLSKSTQETLIKALRQKQRSEPGSTDHTQALDVQVISLSASPLSAMSAGNLVLPDLLALIGVFRLDIKPLRERPEDIMPLTIHFLRQKATAASGMPVFDRELSKMLTGYNWPGNVAELREAISRMSGRAREGRLSIGDLPDNILNSMARSKTDFAADFMNSEHWAAMLKKYLRIACLSPSSPAPHARAPDSGPAQAQSAGKMPAPLPDLNQPHEMFPFWTRSELYDRITSMYLDCGDDGEIARTLANDLRIQLTPAVVSGIRVEAALAAESQPHAVKLRWIYRYRRLTVNNIVKEFMFLENKSSFLEAKRELAHEIMTLVSQTPANRLCIAVNDALGRNNIGADLIEKLEAYGATLLKMKNAAQPYAAKKGLSENAAFSEIAAKLALLHGTTCQRDPRKTAAALAGILDLPMGRVDEHDVAFMLEHNKLADDEKSSARSVMSTIASGADIGTGIQSVLQQVVGGAAHHIQHREVVNLTETIRSHPVMTRTDLEQVRQYAIRHARDIATIRRLKLDSNLPDKLLNMTVDDLGLLERLIGNHIALLDANRFFSGKEQNQAARRRISAADLKVVLERFNRLATPEQVDQLATELLQDKGLEFPVHRYKELRFRLPK